MILTINDNIGDEKLQYDINRTAAKISSLSSGNIDKYEYKKKPSLKNVGFLLNARKKLLNSFKSNIFPLKNSTPESTPEQSPNPPVFDTPKPTKAKAKKTKDKISLLKLHDTFMDNIIDDETL